VPGAAESELQSPVRLLRWIDLFLAVGVALTRNRFIDETAERIREAARRFYPPAPDHACKALFVQLCAASAGLAVLALRPPPGFLIAAADTWGWGPAVMLIWPGVMSVGVACFRGECTRGRQGFLAALPAPEEADVRYRVVRGSCAPGWIRSRGWRQPRFLKRQLVLPVSMTVAVVSHAIERGGGHLGVDEQLGPIGEARLVVIGIEGVLVELADEMERQLAAGPAERQIAEFIDDDEIIAQQFSASERPGAGRRAGRSRVCRRINWGNWRRLLKLARDPKIEGVVRWRRIDLQAGDQREVRPSRFTSAMSESFSRGLGSLI